MFLQLLKIIFLFLFSVGLFMACGKTDDVLRLENDFLRLSWHSTKEGWRLHEMQINANGSWKQIPNPMAFYTLLYSSDKVDSTIDSTLVEQTALNFPEPAYYYLTGKWKENLSPVAMNTAGEAFTFFPEKAIASSDSVVFQHITPVGTLQAIWHFNPATPKDVLVHLELIPAVSGYFSLTSPTLYSLSSGDISWGMVPGLTQGKDVQDNLVLAYAYGQGIPDQPVVFRERTASTLAPMLTNQQGITQAVIPEPGYARDPWEKDENTHNQWKLGLSLMSRKGLFTPTLYHPVLGKDESYHEEGEKISFQFRYVVQQEDWFTVLNHAIYDVYRFDETLALRKNMRSLTDRILAMHEYVTDDQSSLWRIEKFNGLPIGAQAYLGGVAGSDKDAMKNSDYGAMWMLAAITHDPALRKMRLPYARNFKLMQQNNTEGFFKGAAAGQYYLSKSKKFTEEWGNYVEPVALTYYVMLDIGNVLLFEPDNQQLKERLQLGAERLMQWQHEDGYWEVAYHHETHEPLFEELSDLRPTFYGLLVAYRMLGKSEYLIAAQKGADWLIENSVKKGHFLGVCGDARFVPDFATGQMAQAFLDLYEITQEKLYLDAAITCAKIYTASVYTHPVASVETKMVNGQEKQDWEISQAGLSFEHGGSIGSAINNGPILLASHAGMFIRMFQITGEPLFRDMARASAIGRDAFVNEETKVASYYWRTMDAGAGPYPHHAWWQIGWITDYLMSEISLRTAGAVTFPRGFITPKVGPHQCYGFAPGEVFGERANLWLRPDMVQLNDAACEYMGAKSVDRDVFFLMLLNTEQEDHAVEVNLNYKHLPISENNVQTIQLLDEEGKVDQEFSEKNTIEIKLPAHGCVVLVLK